MKNQLSQTSWWSWINVGPSWNNLLSNWCCTISTGSPNFLHQLSPPQRTLKQLQKHHHPSVSQAGSPKRHNCKDSSFKQPAVLHPPIPWWIRSQADRIRSHWKVSSTLTRELDVANWPWIWDSIFSWHYWIARMWNFWSFREIGKH